MLQSGILVITLAIGLLGQEPTIGRQATEAERSSSRVRSTQTWVLDLLRQGEQQSATFRWLMVELAATDAIVYVEPGICAFGHLAACLPHPIVVVGSARYLRVTFDPHRRSAIENLALIGHELQHALEIASTQGVRTPDAVAQLFGRIGFSPSCPAGVPDCYETDAARVIGIRIERELEHRLGESNGAKAHR
jgi:hypothetical protein